MMQGKKLSARGERVGQICESGLYAKYERKHELITRQSAETQRNPIIPVSGQGWNPFPGISL